MAKWRDVKQKKVNNKTIENLQATAKTLKC